MGLGDLVFSIIDIQSYATHPPSAHSLPDFFIKTVIARKIKSLYRNKLKNREFGKEAPLFIEEMRRAGRRIYNFAKIDNCEEILEKTGVELVPGEAFGVPGFAGFSFAETEDEIREGLQRLSF